ncbi:MAG: class I SAM-dependent methyltransferase [Acidobacteria bacterium]|nr:class I SAM-dependent methyltransferase [Acidobacteriota bacterium]
MIVDVLHRIAAHPRAYDWIQQAVGCEKVFERLGRHFISGRGRSVLEVGAGTGLLYSHMPPGTNYIWLDSDPMKLDGFRRRHDSTMAVLGDATQICLANASVHDVLCASVTHHIPDEVVGRLFSELARVARERLIFLDPIDHDSTTSRWLWRLDRGAFPRRPERLKELISASFEITTSEEFEVMHHYLCCVAVPRQTGSGLSVGNPEVGI